MTIPPLPLQLCCPSITVSRHRGIIFFNFLLSLQFIIEGHDLNRYHAHRRVKPSSWQTLSIFTKYSISSEGFRDP